MKFEHKTLVWAFTAALSIGAVALVKAQAPAASGRGGGGRGGAGASLFTAADINKDGSLTRDELKTTFSNWYSAADTTKAGSVTQEQLATAVNAAMPAPAGFGGGGGGRGPQAQNQTPKPEDVAKMMAAIPATASAKPLKPRKVLVLCKASGFVHSSIPLAAKTIEAMGTKTGAYTTTITYDPADINTANLAQYDVLFLDSTTGAFLDDPADSGTTAARKAALLAFVRNGKGIAGIHAASDSYHAAAPAPAAAGAPAGAARGGGGRGGVGTQLVAVIFPAADKNNDQKVTAAEMTALADVWYDKLDTDKAGKINQADFNTRFATVMPPAAPGGGRGAGNVPQGPDNQMGTWPDFNNLIAGFFKFHWVYPQEITVKIDDPKSPLTAMFHGQEFVIHDETYTQSINSSWSRKNVHVLTSIDYDKMTPEDKAKESNPRSDHDYGLSWIRKEGQGRVFYEAHGHDEGIYAMPAMMAHVLAGVQYAAGDLKADDSPSAK